ncbi:hypothetical protein DL768_005314 [Monosporascus sp. mg162]|nr:hypothetical protein DL768_005314 [Monosporascus sp. mg162]
MAPQVAKLNSSKTAIDFRNQWLHPGDVFSVLLLLGGDIIARAHAQFAGHGPAPGVNIHTLSEDFIPYHCRYNPMDSSLWHRRLTPMASDATSQPLTV